MSDVDPVATAEAEIAKAQADLAAAKAEEEATVRLATRSPWSRYVMDDGQVITSDGIDVPETLANELLAAVPAVLRKVDSAS